MNNEGVCALDVGEIWVAELIALSQNVPITCKVMFSCSFWPFNGHLLFIKCVCAHVCE